MDILWRFCFTRYGIIYVKSQPCLISKRKEDIYLYDKYEYNLNNYGTQSKLLAVTMYY